MHLFATMILALALVVTLTVTMTGYAELRPIAAKYQLR